MRVSAKDKPAAVAAAESGTRNAGLPYSRELLAGIRCNRFAAEHRIATLAGRRSVKGDAQTAWHLRAISCIDLTTLSGDDTVQRVRRLCAKAAAPVDPALLARARWRAQDLSCAAVCVYPRFAEFAARQCEGTGVAVAAVAAGFPTGLTPSATKLAEVRAAVRAGADEIDMVVSREHVLTGNWTALYAQVAAVREACANALLKVILGTGDLRTLRNVMRAAMIAMAAGADFIKTSTGKETRNACPVVALAMARSIRTYGEMSGAKVGFKPAGGISSARESLRYQVLMREELGPEWLRPELFRLGASSLLGDLERQLEHRLTGAYSAAHRHALC